MQKKKEPNLEMRKSFACLDVAPTLSLLSVKKKVATGVSSGERQAWGWGLLFRAAPGSPQVPL